MTMSKNPVTGPIPQSLLAIAILLAATVAVFGSVLFSAEPIVLSHPGTDLAMQFVDWRDFGFRQLGQGNLALWNPHIFGGTPYFGGFQSALLYPPNWLYLILPLAKAINMGIALHIFLSGLFMYLWASSRGLHIAACLLSSFIFMFGGAHFPHIYAGHLTNLSCIAWIPLLFLALDGYCRSRSTWWLLLGVFTTTMQILAGHPQYVFYTGVAAVIYLLLRLYGSAHRWQIAAGFTAMYMGGACLSAVQLLSGMEAASVGVRSGGLPYAFAAMFSFPPENFLTLLTPGVLGDLSSFPYWGRWYLWETCLFVGVTGLVLSVCGGIWGDRKLRCFSVTMVAVLLVLALGTYTPLHRLLYTWVPGFNLFRSQAKFIGLASLFIAMLAAVGTDLLLRKPVLLARRLWPALLIVGLMVGGVSMWVQQSADASQPGLWKSVVETMASTQEVYIPQHVYQDPAFVKSAGVFTAKSLSICCAMFLVSALLLLFIKRSPKAAYLVTLVGAVELLSFAATTNQTFDLNSLRIPEIEQLLNSDPGDYRILLPQNRHNSAMSMGARDIWGFDPGVLKRYAEFMTFTQGNDPNQATQYLNVSNPHPLLEMIRCRYLFIAQDNGFRLHTFPRPMPRLNLVDDWQVLSDREAIFAAMSEPSFDPRKKAILETPWEASRSGGTSDGTVRLVDASTDHLTIEASLSSPALLVITDNYSPGWRATALSGSDQTEYQLLPANYVLKAVPLRPGTHRLRVEYLPTAYRVGKWISILALLVFVVVAGRETWKAGILSAR